MIIEEISKDIFILSKTDRFCSRWREKEFTKKHRLSLKRNEKLRKDRDTVDVSPISRLANS